MYLCQAKMDSVAKKLEIDLVLFWELDHYIFTVAKHLGEKF
jgi:hypothetical protein